MHLHDITFKAFIERLLSFLPSIPTVDTPLTRFATIPGSMHKHTREMNMLPYKEQWKVLPCFLFREIVDKYKDDKEKKVFGEGACVLKVDMLHCKANAIDAFISITITIFYPHTSVVEALHAQFKIVKMLLEEVKSDPGRFQRPALAMVEEDHMPPNAGDIADLFWAMEDMGLLPYLYKLMNGG